MLRICFECDRDSVLKEYEMCKTNIYFDIKNEKAQMSVKCNLDVKQSNEKSTTFLNVERYDSGIDEKIMVCHFFLNFHNFINFHGDFTG